MLCSASQPDVPCGDVPSPLPLQRICCIIPTCVVFELVIGTFGSVRFVSYWLQPSEQRPAMISPSCMLNDTALHYLLASCGIVAHMHHCLLLCYMLTPFTCGVPQQVSSASRFPKQSATRPGGVELISRNTTDAYKLCTLGLRNACAYASAVCCVRICLMGSRLTGIQPEYDADYKLTCQKSSITSCSTSIMHML